MPYILIAFIFLNLIASPSKNQLPSLNCLCQKIKIFQLPFSDIKFFSCLFRISNFSVSFYFGAKKLKSFSCLFRILNFPVSLYFGVKKYSRLRTKWNIILFVLHNYIMFFYKTVSTIAILDKTKQSYYIQVKKSHIFNNSV